MTSSDQATPPLGDLWQLRAGLIDKAWGSELILTQAPRQDCFDTALCGREVLVAEAVPDRIWL